MCHPYMRGPFAVEDVNSLLRVLYAGRLQFHAGMAEIAPGVSLHLIGGHTGGLQSLRIATARGWVVLASDATHLWNNIRSRNPFPAFASLPEMLDGWNTLESLADGPDHIIPGHDPLILKRFPCLNGNPDVVQLHEQPI